MAAFVLIPLCASAEEPAKPTAVVLPSNAHALSRVHGGLSADAAKPSAAQRDVRMTAAQPSSIGKPGERPAPTPRILRKMQTDHTLAAIDPAVRACAVDNPTTAPLSFGMRVVIAPSGAVESSGLADGSVAPPLVVTCIVGAVSQAHFGGPGPNGATIAVPITVPGRPASVPPPAAPKPSPTKTR